MKTPRTKPGPIPAMVASALTASALLARGASPDTNSISATSLADLSVEQLMNVSVTSVARHETKFNESPAAISVITQDDIRRFGITTIPDALRLVPGLDVAQINSHEWAISARGFDNEYANKLLVLVDGRSIYGTGFGGVIWSAQFLPMENIDRIEVIRGPGASLWGANAVNGVINIITKSAKDTQGAMISVEGGTLDQPAATVQYGGQLASNLFYRAYAKVLNSDGLVTSTGQDAPDRTLDVQGGFRLDWEPADADRLTLQGDLYRNRLVENQDLFSLSAPYQQTYNEVNYNSGGNVLGRWTHDFSDTQSLTLQTYYDRFKEEEAGAAEMQNTFDFDAQHRFALGNRNEITWGLGYRDVDQDYRSSDFANFNPPNAHDHLLSSFVQDEIILVPDRLKLTLGSKLERNDYTGFEFEPTGRLLWTPTEHQSVWAAISRGVRTPDWLDLHSKVDLLVVPPNPPLMPIPTLLASYGNPNLDAEDVTAYELGYRIEATRHLSFDIAGFYNDYDHLIAPTDMSSQTLIGPNLQPYELVSVMDQNAGSAQSFGAEVSARWDVTDTWHLTANYSWLGVKLGFNSNFLLANPAHQAQLRSTLDLPCHLELNGAVSFVDKVEAPYLLGQMNIPSYVRLDIGLVWHPAKNFELGVWGQNLAEDKHAEFTSYKTVLLTEIPRSVMARLTWRF